MPWGVILMVCGVTVLTALLEQTGGIDLFTTILVKFSTPRLGHRRDRPGDGAGLGLQQHVRRGAADVPAERAGAGREAGRGRPAAIASSILIGGHLVDVSPLSTIGALCVAGAGPGEDRRLLFNRVLAWGLSMAVVGAGICQVVFVGL